MRTPGHKAGGNAAIFSAWSCSSLPRQVAMPRAEKATKVAVFSAIDNLVKGAAGQAVQNMNLMFGLEETEGLLLVGGNP